MAEDLCALFRTFDLRETTEHEKLKANLEDALKEYLKPLPAVADAMDIGEERIDRMAGLCFLYMECPVMAKCLANRYLVSNMGNGGISVTNLSSYQSDVTFFEVAKVLGSLRQGSIINYGDPCHNSYFGAFVPTDRFEYDQKITVATMNDALVEYDVYNRIPRSDSDFPYFFSCEIVAYRHYLFHN